MLAVLGVQPVLGRDFSAEEDLPNSSPVALLSDELWKTRFNSDPRILNQVVKLDGVPYTIVGVMPKGFYVLNHSELLWTPMKLDPSDPSRSQRVHWIFVFLRLPDGMSQKQTQVELDTVAARLRKGDPSGDAGLGLHLQNVPEFVQGEVRPTLLLLMGSVVLVLLIACANVISLLLARGTDRLRELSIRTALGAPRARLIRQLLTESVVLSFSSGVLGLGLSVLMLKLLLRMHPANVPRLEEVRIDSTVLLFTFTVSILVGLLFGIVPAFSACKANPSEVLKENAKKGGRRVGKQRSILILGETSLACILLIGAGLAAKSLWLLHRVDPGFDPHQVSTLRISVARDLAPNRIPDFYRRVLERVRALPGVESATLARDLPMSGVDPSMPVTIEGATPTTEAGEETTSFRGIAPHYFETLRIRLLQGREPNDDDTPGSLKVVVVSEMLARRYWPNESPIGKRLKPEFPNAPSYTVVGVAADVRHWGLEVELEPTAYYPYTQIPPTLIPVFEKDMTIAIRGPSSLVPEVRAAIHQIDESVAVFDVRTMDELFKDSGALRRFGMDLLLGFARLALMLSAIGVYGVVAYTVAQRTHEIAIRMAVGAQRTDIMRLVVAQVARLSIAGVIIGVVASLAISKFMSSLLYQVSPRDLLTFVTVPLVLVLVIAAASYVPARSAASVHPNTALHYE
jgi:putative ABC transport system permease protein